MNQLKTGSTLDTLDLIILARMLAKSPTPASVKKDVGAIAAAQLTPGEWTTRFDSHWSRLKSANLIAPPPGKKPGKTFLLTESGRRDALDFLGTADVPANMTWSKLQAEYLVPKAMGQAPGSKEAAALQKAPRLKQSIVCRAQQVSARDGMQAKQLLAAIAWKAIGVESAADFTAENVIQQVVFRRAAKKMKTPQVIAALAASAVGSTRTGVADLRAAVLRTWLLAPPDIASQPTGAIAGADLESFAREVTEAARRCPTPARFGDNKVFISHVWRQLNGNAAATGDLTDFKQKLIAANRDGLLQLSRADLVEAMNPTDVEESATVYDNATFHFVRVTEGSGFRVQGSREA